MRFLHARTALVLALGTVLAGTPLAAPALVAPAAADSTNAVVIDGNARFQVLTPTLIRLEYAGDKSFQDATTFNAVNRAFPETPFTTSVTSDGFREIRTAAVTLRYRQGSGPFTRANLSVSGTGFTATPAFPSSCAMSTA